MSNVLTVKFFKEARVLQLFSKYLGSVQIRVFAEHLKNRIDFLCLAGFYDTMMRDGELSDEFFKYMCTNIAVDGSTTECKAFVIFFFPNSDIEITN